MKYATTPPAFAVELASSWLEREPERALENFTWVNNVTVGAGHCHFAFADDHCLTHHRGLPFTAIALEGHDPDIIRKLAAALIGRNQIAYSLAPSRLLPVLQSAANALEIRPEWQMLYRGKLANLPPTSARLLRADDLPALMALANAGESMVFGPETFARGEFFGVEAEGRLVAMGGVQTRLPGLAEIGSITTHPAYRRRGYASQVTAALVRHLRDQGQDVFLCLFQTNDAARRLYEKLGFEIVRELFLVKWRLG